MLFWSIHPSYNSWLNIWQLTGLNLGLAIVPNWETFKIIEITPITSGNTQTFTIEKDGISIGSISVPKYLSGTLRIPLVYFLIQFQPLFLNLFLTFSQSEPIAFSIIYTLIFTMSKPTGGVLFGIGFWIITRRLPRTMIIRRYMIMSALFCYLSQTKELCWFLRPTHLSDYPLFRLLGWHHIWY